MGGPSNTGDNAYWEYDSWNGSSWVTEFRITSTGKLSGNAASQIASLTSDNYFTGSNYFGPTSSNHLLITTQGILAAYAANGTTTNFSVNASGSTYATGFYTNNSYGLGCSISGVNPFGCTTILSQPAAATLSVDGSSPGDGQGTVKAKGFSASGSAGFTGTATSGTCTLTITGGLITGTSGC